MKNLLFLFILVLASCSSATRHSADTDMEIKTILKYSDAIFEEKKYSDLFDKVEIIPLDTTGNFLISDIRQVKLALNRIFVLDESRSVYIFDQEGQGQIIINKRGQGVHEYIDIRGFDLTADSLLCLLTFPQKLMYFTLEGLFVNEIKLDLNGSELALLPDNKAAIYMNNMLTTSKEKTPLLEICDQTDGTHQGYIPGYKCLATACLPVYQHGKAFTTTENGELLFTQPLSNNIYAIKDHSIYIKYQIDFEAQTPPDDLEETIHDVNSVSEFIQKNFPVYGFNSSWENSSYFHVQTFIDTKLTTLLYDKKNQKLYSGYLKDDLTGCNTWIIEATDQYLICYYAAGDIMGLADYLKSKRSNLKEFPILEKMVKYAQEKENPMICLYHFKK